MKRIPPFRNRRDVFYLVHEEPTKESENGIYIVKPKDNSYRAIWAVVWGIPLKLLSSSDSYTVQQVDNIIKTLNAKDKELEEDITKLQKDIEKIYFDLSSITIKKTYPSIASMQGDKNPIGDDGKPLDNGSLVVVLNKDNSSENSFYIYYDKQWKILDATSVIIENKLGNNVNSVISQNEATSINNDYNISFLFPEGGTSHNNEGVGPYYTKQKAIDKLIEYLPEFRQKVGTKLTFTKKYGYPETIIFTGGSFNKEENWVSSSLSGYNDGFIYGGIIDKKTIINSDIPSFYIPTETGTYPNFNNLYIDLDNEYNVIFTKRGDLYKKQKAPFLISQKEYRYCNSEFEIYDLISKKDEEGNLLINFSLIAWSNNPSKSTSKPPYDDTVNKIEIDNDEWIILKESESFCYDFKRELFTIVPNNQANSNSVNILISYLNEEMYVLTSRNIVSKIKEIVSKIKEIEGDILPLQKTDKLWQYLSNSNKIIVDENPATDFTSYEPLKVKEGEIYNIFNASGGEFYKRWAVTDDDNNVLLMSSFTVYPETYKEQVIIPKDASKLYLTSRDYFTVDYKYPQVSKNTYLLKYKNNEEKEVSLKLDFEGGWIQSKDGLDANYGILFDYRTPKGIICDKINSIEIEKPFKTLDCYKTHIHFYNSSFERIKEVVNKTNEYPFSVKTPKYAKYLRICHDQDKPIKDSINVNSNSLNRTVKITVYEGWKYELVCTETRLNKVIDTGWKYKKRTGVGDVISDDENNPVKFSGEEIGNRGIIQLPIDYKNTGSPTRLIIFAHGSGNARPTSFGDYAKYVDYLVAEGYAVADCCGWGYTSDAVPSYLGTQFMNTPSNYQSYSTYYHYLINKYNLKKDGVFMFGKSQGALTPFGMPYATNIPILAACSLAGAGSAMLIQYGYHNPDRISAMDDFGFSGMEKDEDGNLIGEAKCMMKENDADYKWTKERVDFIRKNLHKVIPYDPLFQGLVNIDHERAFDIIVNEGVKGESSWRELKPVKVFKVPFIIFVAKDDAGIYFENIIHKIGWDNAGALCVIRRMPSGSGNPHHTVDTAGPFVEKIITELGITLENIPVAYVEMLQFFREFE